MSAFLTATGAVAIAEIGDKTQLLSFILAARFRNRFLDGLRDLLDRRRVLLSARRLMEAKGRRRG